MKFFVPTAFNFTDVLRQQFDQPSRCQFRAISFFLLLLFGLVALMPECYSFQAPVQGNCAVGRVGQIKGHFLPGIAGEETLLISRRTLIRDNNVFSPAICSYTISLYDSGILVWGGDISGPGDVFYRGVWVDQNSSKMNDTNIALHIDSVSLLPDMSDQLIILRNAQWGGSGISSSLALISFKHDFSPVTLLNLTGVGDLRYSIDRKVITISGYYRGPNDCNACGHNDTVRLKYDLAARQFAILNPTRGSTEFFDQLSGRR